MGCSRHVGCVRQNLIPGTRQHQPLPPVDWWKFNRLNLTHTTGGRGVALLVPQGACCSDAIPLLTKCNCFVLLTGHFVHFSTDSCYGQAFVVTSSPAALLLSLPRLCMSSCCAMWCPMTLTPRWPRSTLTSTLC